MPQETIGGNCPNCGLTSIYIIDEGITSSWPGGTSIALIGRCCGCHAFLEGDASSREKYDVVTWFVMSDDKVEFLYGPRNADKARGNGIDQEPLSEFVTDGI